MHVSALFEPAPEQWGYRGDPVLWDQLKAQFGDTPLPETIGDLVDMIDQAFRNEVGTGMLALDEAHVPGLRTGGMSSGMVSGAFWRDTALPLLVQRCMRERDLLVFNEKAGRSIYYRGGRR